MDTQPISQKAPVMTGAGKRPRNVYEDDDYDVVETTPDLAGYFSQFDLSPAQEVTICRAYANYVLSVTKTEPSAKNSKKKEKK